MSDNYIEKSIIRELVRSILAVGYAIDVNDNDADRETHLSASKDFDAITTAIFSPEIDSADYTLDCINTLGEHVGWVRLIDGNGTTVISDYSVDLENVIASANALADHIDKDEEKFMRQEFAAKEMLLKFARVTKMMSDPETTTPDNALRLIHDAAVKVVAAAESL